MQLDQAERGFSFMKRRAAGYADEPGGPSAADLVNEAEEVSWPISFTSMVRSVPAAASPVTIVRAGRGADHDHAATCWKLLKNACRAPNRGRPSGDPQFQALRIAVNDEYGELVAGLEAASGR